MKQRWEIVHRDEAKGAVLAAQQVWVKWGGGGNVGTEAGLHCCGGVGQGKQNWLKRIKNPILKWDRPLSGQGLAGDAED